MLWYFLQLQLLNLTSQMTQGTRRPNQMEFKARPNIAGECLDIFQYKI